MTVRASRLLLDTHVFLWWRGIPAELRKEARTAIAEAEIVFVSAATAWEAAIKSSLGRLELPATVEEGVEESGFERLPVTFAHAERVAHLPLHHRDPFDRMLVAQAQVEELTLVTRDEGLRAYEVEMMEA